jgi:hypothetical protein
LSTPDSIPDEVRCFILDHIVSVEQMETLLLLRAERHRDWTATQVAMELRTSALSAGNWLTDLERRGLLVGVGAHYRFAPITNALEVSVEGLSRIYPERRVTVIELIFSKPNDVIRTFAEAFKLRKEK